MYMCKHLAVKEGGSRMFYNTQHRVLHMYIHSCVKQLSVSSLCPSVSPTFRRVQGLSACSGYSPLHLLCQCRFPSNELPQGIGKLETYDASLNRTHFTVPNSIYITLTDFRTTH